MLILLCIFQIVQDHFGTAHKGDDCQIRRMVDELHDEIQKHMSICESSKLPSKKQKTTTSNIKTEPVAGLKRKAMDGAGSPGKKFTRRGVQPDDRYLCNVCENYSNNGCNMVMRHVLMSHMKKAAYGCSLCVFWHETLKPVETHILQKHQVRDQWLF